MLDKCQFLCYLVSKSVFPLDPQTMLSASADEWNAIYHEMRNHAIAALPYATLTSSPIPDAELRKKWLRACVIQQGRWVQVMHAQRLLIKLLEKNAIPCAIIKGSAAAMAYPHPALRAVGDVDFLVKRRDFDKAAAILEANGYRLTHDKDATRCHYAFEKDGVDFELHRRLPIVREDDETLLALFENGIDIRVWHDIDGFSFPALPTDLNGLVLLFHINQHLRDGLGLRQIIDWTVYLHQNGNWEELLPMIRKTGQEKFARTVTAMCQRYLGLEEIVEESDDLPCDELMAYIMEKGNFGRKSGQVGKIESVFLDMANPVRIFKRLQRGGVRRWKAAKKHRLLRPFAWLYQIGSISCELLRDKMTPGKMLRMRQVGLEQRELIRRLGLDVDYSIKR
ncbi:MAG: nucleotidyltransferase family protein [Thermoguttaceae bacterium]|nr:nucleotidyltransferase family protein [Thermoguttaceae bacterium]